MRDEMISMRCKHCGEIVVLKPDFEKEDIVNSIDPGSKNLSCEHRFEHFSYNELYKSIKRSIRSKNDFGRTLKNISNLLSKYERELS